MNASETNHCEPDIKSEKSEFRRRATKRSKSVLVFVNVPVSQLSPAIKDYGIDYEAKQFTTATTFHGLVRVYQGKRWTIKLFWALVILSSFAIFSLQLRTLIVFLIEKPTVSNIKYIIPKNGLQFPVVTVCNNNPVKKSYVNQLNETGDLSPDVLHYILSFVDMGIVERIVNDTEIKRMDDAYQLYTAAHPEFTVEDFYMKGGYNCTDMLAKCYFGGKRFDCCSKAVPLFTSMGKCFQFEPTGFMEKQYIASDYYGLKILGFVGKIEYLDQFSQFSTYSLRMFVHAPTTEPTLSAAGVSVSNDYSNVPTQVFTAVAPHHYNLLPEDQWGECRRSWDKVGNKTSVRYTQSNCRLMCLAQNMYETCKCAPLQYNVDKKFPTCTPYQLQECNLSNNMMTEQSDVLELCSECSIECDRWVYNVENSYARGALRGVLDELAAEYHTRTGVISANLVSLSVYFREVAYIDYKQEKATDFVRTLSDIGGSMGLYLGASIVTLAELSIFVGKLFWVCVSKQRRNKVKQKKLSSSPSSPTSLNAMDNPAFENTNDPPRKLTIINTTKTEPNEPCVRIGLDLDGLEICQVDDGKGNGSNDI